PFLCELVTSKILSDRSKEPWRYRQIVDHDGFFLPQGGVVVDSRSLPCISFRVADLGGLVCDIFRECRPLSFIRLSTPGELHDTFCQMVPELIIRHIGAP